MSRSSSRKEQSSAPRNTQQDTADISAPSALLALADTGSQADRIDALRHNIANGTYSVSAYRVAGSLLQSLL